MGFFEDGNEPSVSIKSDVFYDSFSRITRMGSSIILAKGAGLKRLTCILEFAGSNLVREIDSITETFHSVLRLFRSDSNIRGSYRKS